ncbi:MAG: maltose alpha-D-glucosyltransferase [Chromatiaceae bacterium]|jgi:maltose alpha-D-glucosyltransferase/alpha-amylase|nr:maltose alpha-D-glucosyltransferase [Chromatiaceae bacterium]
MNQRPTEDRLTDDPLWYKDAVIYQTHVKAFFDTDGDGTGDFRGLTQKLDYVRDLGVNAIWLLPFYPSPMRDDGYDISDYRNIYPPYGTRRDFRRFVSAAHRRGIRVITELVINHTSDQHPWFQAARRASKGSRKRDFYVWSDDDQRFAETRIIFTDTETSNWAWDPVAQQYYWHRFFSHQPDLNHNNPQVVRAVIRVMRFWLDLGVDGLRLDAIPYLCVRDGTSNENLPETHAVIRQMRRVVDTHYQNRMFLAEANQWPEDVRDYFGDGDECHLAYHFPLMPRMYMALAQEDRHPVVEILEQTPEIPPSCQWAIFLRNHDELTLEMVSDRERDYMYQTYAGDPRMRVNVGIRRRLAPLLDNDQDKIRLMHSLLLSMPGSPILYYGDELGMGDNIYLGDRNGVRTPMQWSPDRNAGFSRADPQRLYLPPIMDPIYGYQSVNVEAQQREAASLLNWMRRVIEVRKGHQVFGRGGLELLHPGNRKILAYVREGGDGEAHEVVLCVANLGRGAQPVELDLARYQGRVPIEMLGQTPFPPIGELPYLLTLPGHGFYWFLLSKEAQAPAWHEERLPALKLATLVTPEGWRSLQPDRAERREPMTRALALLEQKVLPAYLPTRRWYAAKDIGIRRVTLGERQEWSEWLLSLMRVELDDGSVQDYFLPLSILWEGRDEEPTAGAAVAASLARVRRHSAPGLLCDAFADERFVRALARAIGEGAEAPLGSGRLVFSPTAAFARLQQDDRDPGMRLLAEGSNSGAVLDDRLFLKGYRRLRPGVNPEVEMGRFLTEVSPFSQIVPLAGSLEYQASGGSSTTLAVLEAYVPNQGDLWQFTLDLLGRLAEAYGERGEEWDADPAQISYAALVDTLGRRIAELHRALAQPGGGAAFDPEPVTGEDLAAWRGKVEREARETLGHLGAHLEELPAGVRTAAEGLLAQGDALIARIGELTPEHLGAVKTRYHGDLHLGQVLVVQNDVVVIDFEGEPARPLAERRVKHSPLLDAAGMVRSFDYAGRNALELVCRVRPSERERLAGPLARWSAAMVQRFLAAYREAAEGSAFYPEPGPQADDLIQLFALEKALYEIRYELDNRPAWVGIPIDGVAAMLGS